MFYLVVFHGGMGFILFHKDLFIVLFYIILFEINKCSTDLFTIFGAYA